MLPHSIHQVLERLLFKLRWCYQITEQLVCRRTNGCQEEGCLLPVIRNAIRCEKMFHSLRVMGPIFFSRVEFPNLSKIVGHHRRAGTRLHNPTRPRRSRLHNTTHPRRSRLHNTTHPWRSRLHNTTHPRRSRLHNTTHPRRSRQQKGTSRGKTRDPTFVATNCRNKSTKAH